MIKIRVIIIPFLIVSTLTIALYTLFRWVFDIKLQMLPIKESLLDVFLPILVSIVSILIWIRRRVKILNVSFYGKESDHHLYYLIMIFIVIISIVNLQDYITKASYSLIKLGQVDQIFDLKKEKYFQLDSFKVDKSVHLGSSFITSRVTGRDNEELRFYAYMVWPFKQGKSRIWYGVQFDKKVSNNLSDEEKKQELISFINDSDEQIEKYDVYSVEYFERLGYSDERDGFFNALKRRRPDFEEDKQVILIPQTSPFEDRLVTPLLLGGLLYIVALVILSIVIHNTSTINEEAYLDFITHKPLKEDTIRDILIFLNPFGKYKFAASIIITNLLVFCLLTLIGVNPLSPTALELFEYGGVRRSEVLNGEYWRLITAIFVHAGVMHLFLNLVSLGFCAMILEDKIASLTLLIIYILCGLTGSIASIYWNESIISVGASGAIFGLYGLLLVFNIFKVFTIENTAEAWGLLIFFGGFSLLLGFLGGGTDNAAHLGGLFAGIVFGLLLYMGGAKN